MDQNLSHGGVYAPVHAELAAVGQVLRTIGSDDGRVLHGIVSDLLLATDDLLRPAIVCLVARALDSDGDPRVVQFAAAVQLVHIAAQAHQIRTADVTGEPRDHLTVLVGDYLYAQAAVLTAGLRHLSVMAMVSEAIMGICRRAVAETARGSLPSIPGPESECQSEGLFELSASGPAVLLGQEHQVQSLAAYGRALDEWWHGSRSARHHAQLSRGASTALEAIAPGAARTALLDLVHYLGAMPQAPTDSLARVARATDDDGR
jgi:hypothetical protein